MQGRIRQTAAALSDGSSFGLVFFSTLLAAGLAACGSSDTRSPLGINEASGRVGKIALGEPLADVLTALGPPVEDGRNGGFATAGKLPSDIDANGGSFSIPGPPVAPLILRYKRLAVMIVQGRVFAVVTDAARTTGGVGVGSRLASVRAVYKKSAKCVPASSGSEITSPAHCAVAVPAGHLSFGGDPIKSIELIGGRRYTGGAPRATYLRAGDSAVFGGVRCTAATEVGVPHMLCQRVPRGDFPYSVVIYHDTILVFGRGGPDHPVYATPHK